MANAAGRRAWRESQIRPGLSSWAVSLRAGTGQAFTALPAPKFQPMSTLRAHPHPGGHPAVHCRSLLLTGSGPCGSPRALTSMKWGQVRDCLGRMPKPAPSLSEPHIVARASFLGLPDRGSSQCVPGQQADQTFPRIQAIQRLVTSLSKKARTLSWDL